MPWYFWCWGIFGVLMTFGQKCVNNGVGRSTWPKWQEELTKYSARQWANDLRTLSWWYNLFRLAANITKETSNSVSSWCIDACFTFIYTLFLPFHLQNGIFQPCVIGRRFFSRMSQVLKECCQCSWSDNVALSLSKLHTWNSSFRTPQSWLFHRCPCHKRWIVGPSSTVPRWQALSCTLRHQTSHCRPDRMRKT